MEKEKILDWQFIASAYPDMFQEFCAFYFPSICPGWKMPAMEQCIHTLLQTGWMDTEGYLIGFFESRGFNVGIERYMRAMYFYGVHRSHAKTFTNYHDARRYMWDFCFKINQNAVLLINTTHHDNG